MPNTMSPYLAFNGQCREALTFYASVFGGTPNFLPFGEAMPGMPADFIMHGQLDTPAGWTIMAADSTAPDAEVVRGGMNLCVYGDDLEQGRAQFDQLADEGTINMPLEQQMWGDLYGDLTDKFGINWGFNLSPAKA